MKPSIIFLSFGLGLFLYTIISREVALLAQHSADGGAPLWLLVPCFLLVSLGAERRVWHKAEAEMVPNLVRD